MENGLKHNRNNFTPKTNRKRKRGQNQKRMGDSDVTFTITIDSNSIKPPNKFPKIHETTTLEDEQEREGDFLDVDNSANADTNKRRKLERCAFWPNCTNENCPFVHPKDPCKNWPNCSFGAKCMYIHPDVLCKYGTRCSRENCAYTHPAKTKVPCKNGFACKNPNCSFQHPPEACKFQRTCKNKHCPFSHEAPCKFSSSCHIRGCKFAHSFEEISTEPSKETLEALSFSLPPTPPHLKSNS